MKLAPCLSSPYRPCNPYICPCVSDLSFLGPKRSVDIMQSPQTFFRILNENLDNVINTTDSYDDGLLSKPITVSAFYNSWFGVHWIDAFIHVDRLLVILHSWWILIGRSNIWAEDQLQFIIIEIHLTMMQPCISSLVLIWMVGIHDFLIVEE